MPEHTPAPPSVRQLPDVNALTNPFDLVQRLLDRAAFLSLYAASEPRDLPAPYRSRDVFEVEGGFVLRPEGRLHPLRAVVDQGRPSQAVGAPLGHFRSRWILSPDDAPWSPGSEPRPVLFEPGRPQRFTVQELEIDLGSGAGTLRGYGQGMTRPVTVEGRRQVLAGAVVNVTHGTGELAERTGTVVFNGRITAGLGFQGSVTVRLLDPEGHLHGAALPALEPAPMPAGEDGTYLVLRGHKKNQDEHSLYSFTPGDPVPVGLETPAHLFAAEYRSQVRQTDGLRTQLRVGQEIGGLVATVLFDVTEPSGTAARPSPFRTRNTYRFTNDQGQVVGSIQAHVELGRTFGLRLDAPDQEGIRYGGVGPIVASSGLFAGVQGMVAVNSAVGLAPHALSLLNVLRIVDPQGRFRRSAGNGG